MTEIVPSINPILATGCPLLAALLIFLLRKRPNFRESCTIIAAVVQFGIILSMAPTIKDGSVIYSHIINIGGGIDLAYRVDAFGLIFAITSSFLWILVSLYSIGYMRALTEHAQTRYYVMFALAIFSDTSRSVMSRELTVRPVVFFVSGLYRGVTRDS